ncbi:MAG: hypothetical protein ACUVXF_08125, partial [Desulfobaccales bacterium]
KRGRRLEHLSFVYDHSQGKTVPDDEILPLGLLTPRNFYPVSFGHHLSPTAPAEAPEAQPRRTRGDLARRLKEARELSKPALALKLLKKALAQGIPAFYLISPSFAKPNPMQGVGGGVRGPGSLAPHFPLPQLHDVFSGLASQGGCSPSPAAIKEDCDFYFNADTPPA